MEADVLPEPKNRLGGFVAAKVDLSARPAPGSFPDRRAVGLGLRVMAL